MGSKSNGQRSNDTVIRLPDVDFSRSVRSFENNNKKKKDSQVFRDATISVPSQRNGFPQQHSATEDHHRPSYKTLESFNNRRSGSQDFTKTRTKSFGIGKSFNNDGSGSQDFTKTTTETIVIEESFNNGGSGSQVFKNAIIRCVHRTSGILDFFNHAGNWAANLLQKLVTLLTGRPGIHHSFNCPTGSQDFEGAHIIV
ncbi:uncharacterized protein LOC109813226 [Cajanus cajan]|uniref:uncharacterized protein LOC109813226 n=1 Tax=Cajanus cajan TaxID=3821 RepID=UPI00098DC9A0|nr:uncharacterized protein LOC109813226 [Cajanus cajan]XP_020232971.1 uncharacterized protein LOC109813226 [Cajanus cajan]